jgi:hypothetical protein
MSAAQLIGTWKLVSFTTLSDGKVAGFPMGEDCQGILSLDAAGNLNGQLMTPHRPKFATSKLLDGTPEETENAYKGYFAYWGSYTVDEAKSMVTTAVEGCLFPNWIGTIQDRVYTLEGNQMSLKTTPLSIGGKEIVGELTWERAV